MKGLLLSGFIVFSLLTGLSQEGFAQYSQYCSHQPSSPYTVREFQRFENRFSRWETRYHNAPMYSQERELALRKMNRIKDRGVQFLRDSQMAYDMGAVELESFVLRMDTSYSNSNLYTVRRSFYQDARTVTWEQYKLKAKAEVECYMESADYGFQVSKGFTAKFRNSNLYTMKRSSYQDIMNFSWQHSLEYLRWELNNWNRGFRPIENRALGYYNEYLQANLYTIERSSYQTAMNLAFEKSLQIFRNRLPRMPQRRVQRLYDRYSRLYREAQLYTRTRTYYQNMRDAAYQYL